MTNPISVAFGNVAWKRTLLISAVIGLLGTLGATDRLKTPGAAISYAVGFGTGNIILMAGATAACSKQRFS